jgi:hypothetical protein
LEGRESSENTERERERDFIVGFIAKIEGGLSRYRRSSSYSHEEVLL